MKSLVPLVLALCVGCSSACKVIEVLSESQITSRGGAKGGVFKSGTNNNNLGGGSLYLELIPFYKPGNVLDNIYVKLFYKKSPTAQLEFLDYVKISEQLATYRNKVKWERNPSSVQEANECIVPAAKDDISVTVHFHKEQETSERQYKWYKGKYERGASFKIAK